MKHTHYFIPVLYKPKENILNLFSVLAHFSTIVVSNDSQLPASSTSEFLMIKKKNIGFSGGANAGIQAALSHGAEWMTIVNQDIHVDSPALASYLEELKPLPPGIYGPKKGFINKHRWTSILTDRKSPFALENLEYISGSFFSIHREVIKQVGMFYEPYFLYYEDVDLSIRAQKRGLKLARINLKGFTHTESSTLGRESFLHQYYLARNHLLFVERQAPVGIKAREFARLPKTIWEHYEKKERGSLVGVRDYFFRRFGGYKHTL